MEREQAHQELEFIKKVMADSRRIVATGGNEMIAWGILVTVGMLAMYAHLPRSLGISTGLLWGILIGAGWVYSLTTGLRRKTKTHAITFSGKMLGSIWLSCGIAMSLIGFIIVPSGLIQWQAIIPLMAIVVGIGYFVTATIYRDTFTRIAAFAWWIAGAALAYYPGWHQFLIFAFMMIAFQIVPGIIYHNRWKQQSASHESPTSA